MKEIERERDIALDVHTYDTTCLGCGKEIRLWENGGELDWRECCGYSYYLEMSTIDFVVYGPEEGEA